jgi:predicted metal-binding membrane protein
MPLEGHFQRVNTPLRRLTRRERNVVIAVVAITLASFIALLLATASDSRPGPAPGCIRVIVAGRTGGEIVAGCGASAEAICAHSARFDDPRAAKVVESCREAKVPTTGTPGGPFSVKRLR